MADSELDSSAGIHDDAWTVFRQGDDGNRFVVQTGLTRDEANRLVAELEARGHKQHYWAARETVRRESEPNRS
jgi:hypothetical protein